MPISLATLGKLRYFPELIPDASVTDLLGGAVSPPVVSLRRFEGKVVRLAEVTVAQDTDVEMRVNSDEEQYSVPLGAVPSYSPLAFDLESLSHLAISFWAAAAKSGWRTLYAVWVYPPTVAHKLALGMPLDAEEQEIAKAHNIADTVEKGLLPLPVSYQVLREYRPIHEWTMTRVLNLTAGTPVIADTISAKVGEVVILTGIACDPGTAANGITLTVNRDDDYGVVDMPVYPMTFDRLTPCWIPATKRLWIMVQSVTSVSNWRLRYTVRRCRLTNILRARWGLASRAELPGDVWTKVRGGIL